MVRVHPASKRLCAFTRANNFRNPSDKSGGVMVIFKRGFSFQRSHTYKIASLSTFSAYIPFDRFSDTSEAVSDGLTNSFRQFPIRSSQRKVETACTRGTIVLYIHFMNIYKINYNKILRVYFHKCDVWPNSFYHQFCTSKFQWTFISKLENILFTESRRNFYDFSILPATFMIWA